MNTQGFFSRADIGGIDEMIFLDELKKANKKNKDQMTTVQAKFRCDSVIPNPYSNSRVAHFHAVYGTDGENASFSKATPSGMLSMTIDNETLASTFFEQGKDYYLTFTTAE